jgi:hypothetical protein
MPDILKPEKNSKDNILLFLETIEDEELRELIKLHLENILEIGANQDADRALRNEFFDAISQLVNKRGGVDNAD